MYICSYCDAQFLKWTGQCAQCQKWGTVKEEDAVLNTSSTVMSAAKPVTPVRFESIDTQAHIRLSTHEEEIDRVLGGGIVPGSLLLLSGEPGIGKSTLVARIACAINKNQKNVLYISGEESAPQLQGRLSRLGMPFDHLRYLEARDAEILSATIKKEQPLLVIIDSIQTISSGVIDAHPGSPTIIRYATNLFLETAKQTHVPILLIGQVTKEGSLAGPKTLEHLVDVVLTLEGDPVHPFRLLRATKNRFGATGEIGVFEMTGRGLEAVTNPSERFLEERLSVPGSVTTATLEGSRVFLVEVQALVEKTHYPTPIRRASGFDQNRLMMLCAILSKRANMKLADKDVYVNVIGGMELREPAVDLAVCAAIVSAQNNTAKKEPIVYLGEVGLGGELRSVSLIEKRIKEIKRLGIKTIVVPEKQKKTGITGIRTVQELENL